jgi:glycine/D-amino acid oxidase-like deaminating enzyme
MVVDCIIVGQGICGTLLSRELTLAGKTVLTVDLPDKYASGKAASGMMNPVTGMRMAKAWMADELLPVARQVYQQVATELNCSLLQTTGIIDFHRTADEKKLFYERMQQYTGYLAPEDEKLWLPYFHAPYGIGRVTQGMLVNMKLLQQKYREQLANTGRLLEEQFDLQHCTTENGRIQYKDIAALYLIFCDGPAVMNNPWFRQLPFSLNKGEALIADIPGLPRGEVFKSDIKITPWEQDLFWVGTSFDWNYTTPEPSAAFRTATELAMKHWLKLPFTIQGHLSGIRPATVGQKPVVGMHPQHRQIGIFNGMGSKGCTQAPYFARQLAAHVVNGTPIHPEASINRFSRILARGTNQNG